MRKQGASLGSHHVQAASAHAGPSGVLVLVGGSPFDCAGLGSTWLDAHGVQEARGSSPLDSTSDIPAVQTPDPCWLRPAGHGPQMCSKKGGYAPSSALGPRGATERLRVWTALKCRAVASTQLPTTTCAHTAPYSADEHVSDGRPLRQRTGIQRAAAGRLAGGTRERRGSGVPDTRRRQSAGPLSQVASGHQTTR